MITLDGINLGELLINEPTRLANTDVTAVTDYTLSGVPIIWEAERFDRAITLEGGEDTWLSKEVLDAVKDMARVRGATYTLVLHDNSAVQVRFRHESPPVITATPVLATMERPNDAPYNNIIIQLAEVV